MDILENISLAFAGLRASKMRALLTMLGIIIGIGSVIGIVTIGNSLTGTVSSAFSGLGMNNIMVNVSPKDYDVEFYYTENDALTMDNIKHIKEVFKDDIDNFSITNTGPSGKSREGYREIKINTTGVTSGYLDAGESNLVEGRFISDRDIDGVKPVIVIHSDIAITLFDSYKNAIGKEIKIDDGSKINAYTIIGVVGDSLDELKNNPMFRFGGSHSSSPAYIPITAIEKTVGFFDGYFNVTFIANSSADIFTLGDKLTEFINRNYYSENPYFQVESLTMRSMLDEMTTVMNTIQIGISVIAAISLLVGGIGVMNIMLVSVTERTSEIGTRKALGAREADIRMQFIIESVILCLIGGIIGIGLGLIIGNIGALLLSSTAQVSLSAVVIAVIFSMFIGIFFGYYPANKAAKLDPIEALRYE